MQHPTIKFANPKHGEVYWVDFNPTIGSEQGHRRPCVIVSPNSLNGISTNRTVIVLPISNQGDGDKLRVSVSGGKTTGFALIHQIRVIDKCRLQELIELLPNRIMGTIRITLQQFFT